MKKRMILTALLLVGSTAANFIISEAEQVIPEYIKISETQNAEFVLGSEYLRAGAMAIATGQLAQNQEVDTGNAPEINADILTNEVPEVTSEYADIAIAQVSNYVNVRKEPNTESEILGKLYHNSAAIVKESTENGWYRIQSGTVEGYVKAEYVVVGDETLAKSVGTRYATVTATTLFVRSEPTTESDIITMLPEGDDLVALDESVAGWIKVTTEKGEGYISADYVTMSTKYAKAESKAEEEARRQKEEADRKAAAEAAEKAREEAAKRQNAAIKENSNNAGNKPSVGSSTNATSGVSSNKVSNGQAVVDYAKKFLGNPYVYGGTSLTNGADCSGFVQSVYKAFGVNLPRTSAQQRSAGYGVSLSEIQPGDIVCYSGHVGIYVGNNTLIHASNEKTGITLTSPVTYRQVLAVRRIF